MLLSEKQKKSEKNRLPILVVHFVFQNNNKVYFKTLFFYMFSTKMLVNMQNFTGKRILAPERKVKFALTFAVFSDNVVSGNLCLRLQTLSLPKIKL